MTKFGELGHELPLYQATTLIWVVKAYCFRKLFKKTWSGFDLSGLSRKETWELYYSISEIEEWGYHFKLGEKETH